jgi:hypothetical protein
LGVADEHRVDGIAPALTEAVTAGLSGREPIARTLAAYGRVRLSS